MWNSLDKLRWSFSYTSSLPVAALSPLIARGDVALGGISKGGYSIARTACVLMPRRVFVTGVGTANIGRQAPSNAELNTEQNTDPMGRFHIMI